jgi:hypothetical protein
MNTATSRPLVPDDLKPSSLSLPRAAYVAVAAAIRDTNPEQMCAKIFPHDRTALALLTRAATPGASTGGWGAELASKGLAAWVSSLPASGAAALIRRGIILSIVPFAWLSIPCRAGPPSAANWVAEGVPVFARSYALSAALLSPKKLGCIASLSRELATSSAAEAVIGELMAADCGVALDLAYFSDQPGSSSAHQGLLYGLTPGTGSASMVDDMCALAALVGANSSGGSELLFFAAPGRAHSARLRMPAECTATIFGSLALAPNVLVCADPSSIVHGFSGDAEVDASIDATVVMSDTATNVGEPGTPATVGAPTQSMFQSGQISVRALVDVAWARTRPDACALLTGCSW